MSFGIPRSRASNNLHLHTKNHKKEPPAYKAVIDKFNKLNRFNRLTKFTIYNS